MKSALLLFGTLFCIMPVASAAKTYQLTLFGHVAGISEAGWDYFGVDRSKFDPDQINRVDARMIFRYNTSVGDFRSDVDEYPGWGTETNFIYAGGVPHPIRYAALEVNGIKKEMDNLNNPTRSSSSIEFNGETPFDPTAEPYTRFNIIVRTSVGVHSELINTDWGRMRGEALTSHPERLSASVGATLYFYLYECPTCPRISGPFDADRIDIRPVSSVPLPPAIVLTFVGVAALGALRLSRPK
jgi:hypothetical protein